MPDGKIQQRHILFVNTPSYIGGAEISLLTLMKNLDQNQFKPYLITTAKGNLFDQASLQNIPVNIHAFPWFRRRYPWIYGQSIFRLTQIIRERQITLIHTNCDHSLRYVMYASWLAKVPYVSHVRDFVRTWFQPEKVAALKRATRIIANSHSIAHACIQAGICSDRVVTIYNPIDIEVIQQTPSKIREKIRTELFIPQKSLVIGIVGSIQPLKGHTEFINASLEIAAHIPEMHFIVVGNTPDESNKLFFEELKTIVSRSRHAERFHFLGFREDIPDIMQTIDILVIPSWREPFGRVAVEGLAAGCAVIGTNVGGLPEIITHDVDGILIPPKDPDALLAGIHRLLCEPELRKRFSKAGKQTAQRFTIRRHVKQIQKLYNTIP